MTRGRIPFNCGRTSAFLRRFAKLADNKTTPTTFKLRRSTMSSRTHYGTTTRRITSYSDLLRKTRHQEKRGKRSVVFPFIQNSRGATNRCAIISQVFILKGTNGTFEIRSYCSGQTAARIQKAAITSGLPKLYWRPRPRWATSPRSTRSR